MHAIHGCPHLTNTECTVIRTRRASKSDPRTHMAKEQHSYYTTVVSDWHIYYSGCTLPLEPNEALLAPRLPSSARPLLLWLRR